MYWRILKEVEIKCLIISVNKFSKSTKEGYATEIVIYTSTGLITWHIYISKDINSLR